MRDGIHFTDCIDDIALSVAQPPVRRYKPRSRVLSKPHLEDRPAIKPLRSNRLATACISKARTAIELLDEIALVIASTVIRGFALFQRNKVLCTSWSCSNSIFLE